MLKNKLEKIGLDDKEARVYLAALELGETNIERLSKKSGIKRTTVYDVIESLKEKGLVCTIVRNNRRKIFASDPRELENKVEEKKNLLNLIMPELLSITNLIDNKPKIKFYEGMEGLKEIYNDTLRYPNQSLWAWVTEGVFDLMDNDFLDHYISKRVKSKILAYVIIPKSKKLEFYRSQDVACLRKSKVDVSQTYNAEVEIDLYGDSRIGIISFKEKIGLIIDSKKIFNTLKSIFDSHWNSL